MGLALALLAVFFVPAFVKADPRHRDLQHPKLHVLGGVVDVLACATLYWLSLDAFVEETNAAIRDGQLYEKLEGTDGETRVAVSMGTPAMVLIAHALQPDALALTACLVYGVIRSLDAGLSGGFRGPLPTELVGALLRSAFGGARRAHEARALGKERLDTLLAPEQSKSGALELVTNRKKPFTDVQVVRFRDQLFIIDGCDDVPGPAGRRGFRYRFRPLEAWEPVTGFVFELPGHLNAR